MTPESEDDYHIVPEWWWRWYSVYYNTVIHPGNREKNIIISRLEPQVYDGDSVCYWFRRPDDKTFMGYLIDSVNLTVPRLEFSLRSRHN